MKVVVYVIQQIYGYEDLHMLQSRLPMVSLRPSNSLLKCFSAVILNQGSQGGLKITWLFKVKQNKH